MCCVRLQEFCLPLPASDFFDKSHRNPLTWKGERHINMPELWQMRYAVTIRMQTRNIDFDCGIWRVHGLGDAPTAPQTASA